ncbi:uncharacterized protein LOC133310286 isoform X2 [Gastrolobium bilobum]|nr:uncharacterized protein LOC133310286 isoform X2 [Gastrolobium bilobum]XP_061367172.1 uncharacterized protein LOC133310286 isoform X2 [Gastrolobium bilobum]
MRAYGEEATLLLRACAYIIIDRKNVPINCQSWANILKSYKQDCYNILKAPNTIAVHHCLFFMGRKYRSNKIKFWDSNFKPSSCTGDLVITNIPCGLLEYQWSSFVDYHLWSNYQELNPGHDEDRSKLYITTHKKKRCLLGKTILKGRFEMLSLSGSFMLSESSGSSTDGRVIGGVVAGVLIAASPGGAYTGQTLTPLGHCTCHWNRVTSTNEANSADSEAAVKFKYRSRDASILWDVPCKLYLS